MKFEEKSFSSRPASDEYRANWEATFGKKPAESASMQVASGGNAHATILPCPYEIRPKNDGPWQSCTLGMDHLGAHNVEPKLCSFELPVHHVYGHHHNVIGATSGKRCVLPEGHVGNHQMEAY